MSSLGISLLILVIVGVGGVAAYNFWLMRGHSRSLTDLLLDELDAPEGGARRAEPSLAEDDRSAALRVQQEAVRWLDQHPEDLRDEPLLSAGEQVDPSPPNDGPALPAASPVHVGAAIPGTAKPESPFDSTLTVAMAREDAGRPTFGSMGSPAATGWSRRLAQSGDSPDPALPPLDGTTKFHPPPGAASPQADEIPARAVTISPPPPSSEAALLSGGEGDDLPRVSDAARWAGDEAHGQPLPARAGPERPRPNDGIRPPDPMHPHAGGDDRDDNPTGSSASAAAIQSQPVPAAAPVASPTPEAGRPNTEATRPDVDDAGAGPIDASPGNDAHAGADLGDAGRTVALDGDATAVSETGAPSGPADEEPDTDPFHLTLLIEFDTPVPGARLSRWTRDMHRVGSKPIDVAGRHVLSDGSRRFDVIRESMPYDGLLLRLLLVNRQGPLNAMEFSEFASHVQRVGEEFEVLIDAPDMTEVLARARELDELIGPLDAQIAVNVEVQQALSPDEFSRISRRLGLHEQTSQRYVRLDRHDEPLFSAALTEAPGRILLLLDVPRAMGEGQPIREVVETAWKYAQAFEGRMVDDAGQPIDNALFDRIEHQLDTLYHALEANRLRAGSALARRVFNL
ncbi:MAG: hypothetical protein R3E87_08770 [Burkholderiaceae bacterium]